MIIVTGANGFIGSVIARHLASKGREILALVDTVSLGERPKPGGLIKTPHFLTKNELWQFLDRPEAKSQTKWIVHMGANSSTTEKNREHLWENNTEYTQKIWNWCAQHGVSLIYASSAATYGAGELGYDDSTDSESLRPLNLYGESKVLFDRWAVKQTNTPPRWYGLKFFNVYGPNEYHKNEMASLVLKAFHQIRHEGSLRLFKSYKPEFKDGEQKRDFVYVKDVMNWAEELMIKSPQSGIYNMGSGTARTWNDLAHAVFLALQKPAKIEYTEMPESIRDQYQYFTQANMNRWRQIGMSAPQWSLEAGVRDYIQNYLLKDEAYF